MTLTIFERTMYAIFRLLTVIFLAMWFVNFFPLSSRLVPATDCFPTMLFSNGIFAHWLSLHKMLSSHYRFRLIRGLKFFVVIENLYPCSFKCLARSRHRFCLFVFCFSPMSRSVLSSLFSFYGSFSSILLTVFSSQHHISDTFNRNRYFLLCSGFWNIFFTCSVVVLPAEPNRCLLKTTAIFLRVFS